MVKIALLIALITVSSVFGNRKQMIGSALQYGLQLGIDQKIRIVQRFRLLEPFLSEQDALLLARLSVMEEIVDLNFDFFQRLTNLLHSMGVQPEHKYSILRATVARLLEILRTEPGFDLSQHFYAIATYAAVLGRQVNDHPTPWEAWVNDEIPILPSTGEPELPFLIRTRRIDFREPALRNADIAYNAFLESERFRRTQRTRFFRALAIAEAARVFVQTDIARRLFIRVYDALLGTGIDENLNLTETEYFAVEFYLIATLRDFQEAQIDLEQPGLFARIIEYYHAARTRNRAVMERIIFRLPPSVLSCSYH